VSARRSIFALALIAAPVVAQTPSAAPVRPVVARVVPKSIADSAIVQLESLLQRYPDSPLRPGALYELGELLTRRADERFAASQRADSTGGAARPDYTDAIARYEEIVKRFPNFDQIDGAAYTLGTLYSFDQRYAEAVPMFELVASKDQSPHKAEALFRLGDAEFEIAANQKGDARIATFGKAATAYERAAAASPANGDVYFLSLYKLGWAYYNTATPQNPAGYNQAVEVFGRLVDAYDKLTPDRQQRLGLREEALAYMAISFTQVGGASAADKFFASRADSASLKIPVLRRVAAGLRDQGDFAKAVDAYQELLVEAPDDSSALSTSREVIDIYQNRTLEPEKAQGARLALVQKFGPGSSWIAANPTHEKDVATTREEVLRQSGQYELAKAQGSPTQIAPAGKGRKKGKPDAGTQQEAVAVTPAAREHYTEAARLYGIYMADYGQSDSAREVDIHYADALYGAGDFRHAGTEYTRAAFNFPSDTFDVAVRNASQQSAQNAIVAWDSVTVHNATDRAAQDSLFAAVDNFSTRYPHSEIAKKALIEKGRRAAEGGRWDVEAQTFRIYALQYPNDPYAATAAKQVGDALYKQGKYADAQLQWDSAAATARATGRKAFADSITGVQQGAAAGYADSLIKSGAYDKAAKEVYIALADKNPSSEKAPDALRNAIETYMLADSAARAKGDANASKDARTQAATLANRLVTEYPLYRYRLQYQTLYADLLEEIGEGDQSVAALRKLIADNPAWRGRADAEIKIAVRLDSLGKGKEAGAAYQQFAADYRQDPRAPDALYNAAVTYLQAKDTLTAAHMYGEFVDRYPKDSRAAEARVYRVQLLRAGGDTATAGQDLNRLCSLLNPPPELKGDCAARAGRTAFDEGLAEFLRYRDVKLVIATRGQLTAAGVKKASALKQKMLETVTQDFTRAIESGDPQYLAAGSYYVGYAQWEYGNFLKNVQLPKSLTDAERTAASQGAGAQAQGYYTQAQKTWQALVDKAGQDGIKNAWIDLARDGTTGKVPDLPPTPGGLK
jgi:TolA-binding protein